MTTPTKADIGRFELHYAHELTVLTEIQRSAPDRRVNTLAREWDRAKEGILLVAKITDGVHAGTLHVYDGGTRWKAKVTGAPRANKMPMVPPEPDYVFECYVRDMTTNEASAAFLSFNRDSTKPGSLDTFRVGVAAGEPLHLALQEVLNDFGLSVGLIARSDVLAAVTSAERVLKMPGRSDSADYAAGKALLTETLSICREIYSDGHAYDSDLIQAIAKLLMLNRLSTPQRRRLIEVVRRQEIAAWRAKAAQQRDTEQYYSGGSASRSTHLARHIGAEFNKRIKAKLVIPKLTSEVDDLDEVA